MIERWAYLAGSVAIWFISACDTSSPVAPETSAEQQVASEPASNTDAINDPMPDSALPVKTRTSAIDWSAARRDYADRTIDSEDLVVSIQSAEETASVPVMLLTGRAETQSSNSGIIFRRTPDGYFAFYPGADYNIIVTGTNQVIETPAAERTNPERKMVFSETVAGAHVWLTRYGADYVVAFECNELDDDQTSCIDEASAFEIAETLIVAGTR